MGISVFERSIKCIIIEATKATFGTQSVLVDYWNKTLVFINRTKGINLAKDPIILVLG